MGKQGPGVSLETWRGRLEGDTDELPGGSDADNTLC